jgi:UDP-N-acetylmuramoyl-L-alanyl-D-glutamate--2,6-diaminopimelate ligase
MTVRSISFAELAAAVPGADVRGQAAANVTGVCYDSRLVQPGDLFAALRGADFDGHRFVAEAETRGAAALLVEEPVETALPQIVVENSRASLAAASAAFFCHPSRDINVIGITGTDGKTTTSYILHHLLKALGSRPGMVGTVAIRIGDWEEVHSSRQTTPESNDVQAHLRRMVDAGADWAILEATSHGLAMHRLDHVRFQIGAVTNITHEHLEFHGSIAAYRRAKATLLERVAAEDGVVVLNADDPGALSIQPFAGDSRVIKYSVADPGATVRALDVRADANGSAFVLDAGASGRTAAQLPLIGEFNVSNALCAAAVALAAGYEIEPISQALATTPPVPGRMTRVDVGQPFGVIVDYAHTPDSLAKVLRLLRRLVPTGRLIAVFGSAGERDIEKRPMQGAVSARLADLTVVTSEDPRFEDADAIIRQIAEGAIQAGAKPGQNLFTRNDRRAAVQLAFALAQPGDCVLLAGKGHEGSIIWGNEKRPWDEAGVARELLSEAGYTPRQDEARIQRTDASSAGDQIRTGSSSFKERPSSSS